MVRPGARRGGGYPGAIGRCVVDGRWGAFAAVEVEPAQRRAGSRPPSWPRWPGGPSTRAPRRHGSRWRRTTRGPGLYTGMGFAAHHAYHHYRAPDAAPAHRDTAVERARTEPCVSPQPPPPGAPPNCGGGSPKRRAPSGPTWPHSACWWARRRTGGWTTRASTPRRPNWTGSPDNCRIRPGTARAWATALRDVLGDRSGSTAPPRTTGDWSRRCCTGCWRGGAACRSCCRWCGWRWPGGPGARCTGWRCRGTSWSGSGPVPPNGCWWTRSTGGGC
ncbi:hypothetical protein SFUMM280S_04447 [Streptomyces fumanus]